MKHRYGPVLGMAATIALFVGSLAWGGDSSRDSGKAASEPRFILALYEGAAFDDSGSHVPEYVAWAKSLREKGTRVEGEEIGGPGVSISGTGAAVRVEPESGDGERLAGYFVVEARDMDDAIRIAKTCPHVRHRGRVVVRSLAR
jgi:YCII-related domain-containing protein